MAPRPESRRWGSIGTSSARKPCGEDAGHLLGNAVMHATDQAEPAPWTTQSSAGTRTVCAGWGWAGVPRAQRAVRSPTRHRRPFRRASDRLRPRPRSWTSASTWRFPDPAEVDRPLEEYVARHSFRDVRPPRPSGRGARPAVVALTARTAGPDQARAPADRLAHAPCAPCQCPGRPEGQALGDWVSSWPRAPCAGLPHPANPYGGPVAKVGYGVRRARAGAAPVPRRGTAAGRDRARTGDRPALRRGGATPHGRAGARRWASS